MASSSIYGAQTVLRVCEEHKEELEMYCYDCKLTVCVECAKTAHKEHKWGTIARACKEIRVKLSSRCSDIRNTEIKQIEDRLKEIRNIREEYGTETKETIQEIKDQGEIILAAVKEEMEKKLSTCKENLEEGKRSFNDEESKLVKMMEDITIQVDFLEEESGRMTNNQLIEVQQSLDKLIESQHEATDTPSQTGGLDQFSKGEVNYRQVQGMIGKFVSKDDKPTTNATIRRVSSFNHGVDQISHISPINENVMWLNCIRSTAIERVTKDNKTCDEIDVERLFNGFTEGENGNHIYTNDRCIMNVDGSGTISKLFSVAPLVPVAIQRSLDGGLLVTLMEAVSFKIDEMSRRILRHYSMSGELWREYEFTNDGKTRLFTYPSRLSENFNKDICVVDVKGNSNGRLCILQQKEGLKSIYSGQKSQEPFCPSGVTNDSCCNILCTDVYNNAIHILNPAGHFLQYLITKADCVERPSSIALYKNTLFVGGNTGNIMIYTYSS